MFNIKFIKLFFIFSIFSIHLVPFAHNFEFETIPILLISIILFIFLFKDFNIQNYIKSKKLISFLVLYFFLFYLIDIYSNNNFVDFIRYLIGPLVFLSFFHIKNFFAIDELIFFGIFIISLYLIFLLEIPIIYNLTCSSLEFFIARLDCSNSVNLNRPFLITPEPSYLSLMLSFYLILLNTYKINVTNNNKSIIILIVEICICFIIYQTYSRIGLIFLFSFLGYKFLYHRLYKNISVIVFALLLLFNYVLFSNLKLFNSDQFDLNDQLIESRKVLNIDKIISNTSSKLSNDLLYTTLEQINNNEPTGFVRLFHNYLSLIASYENKFIGHGIGSYKTLWYQHAKQHNLDDLVKTNEVMSKWYPNIEEKKQNVQNYFFSVLHDFGVLPVLLILLAIFKSFLNVISTENKFGYVILIYIIITFFTQSPITSPYPWLSLAIIFFNKKIYA